MSKKAQTHCCATCKKTYKRKIYYDRHVSTCKLLHMSPADLDRAADAYEPLPSQREMFTVIQSLAARCDTMEQKMVSMENSMNRSRRKLDIGKWLCGSGVPAQSMGLWEWLAPLTISDAEFDKYTQFKLCDAMIRVLVGFVRDTEGISPLRSVTARPNDLYVWDGVVYAPIDGEDMVKLMNELVKKLFAGLVRWGDRMERVMGRKEYCLEYAGIAKRFSPKNSQALLGRLRTSVCGAIAEHAEMVVLD